MDEKEFLASGNIKVTNARFVVGAQTYAMSSVNSVKVTRTDVSASNSIPGLMVGVGAIWLLVQIVTQWRNIGGYLVPALLLGGGIFWIWNIQEKFEYKLVLTTSSGETTALVSNSAADVQPVEKALTDAIIYRG